MNKLAKILILVLSIALVFAGLTLAIFAADEDTTAYKYGGFTVNSTEYTASNDSGTTLAEAVAAATADDVITLTNNIDMNGTGLVPTVNLTINMNGKSVTNAATFLTVKNKSGLTVNLIGAGSVACTGRFIDAATSPVIDVNPGEGNRLTVTQSATISSNSYNVMNFASGKATLKNLDVVASGAISQNCAIILTGLSVDFSLQNSTVTATNTDTKAEGYAVSIAKGSLDGVVIDGGTNLGRGVLVKADGNVQINNCRILTPLGIRQESNSTLNVTNTQIKSDGASGASVYTSGKFNAVNSSFESADSNNFFINSNEAEDACSVSMTNCILKGNSTYAMHIACICSEVTLNNCKVLGAQNGIYANFDSVPLTLKECYVETGYDAFEVNKTAGIEIDACVIRSNTTVPSATGNGSGNGVFDVYGTTLTLGANNYLINVKNSTISAEGYSSSIKSKVHIVFVKDGLSAAGSITGIISFDNCNLSTPYRIFHTNLPVENVTAADKLTIKLNNSRIETLNYGQAEGLFRGAGTLIYTTGATKIITPKKTAYSGTAPEAGTLNFGIGTRFNFSEVKNATGYTLPDGCSLVYDPFGCADAPYVVSDTLTDATGFTKYDFADTEMGIMSIGSRLTSSNTLNHLGYNSTSAGDAQGVFTVCEANNNAYMKYTLPQATYTSSNGNNAGVFDAEAGTFTFTKGADWASLGGGTLATTSVKTTTLTEGGDEYKAKSVIVYELDLTSGSDAGYPVFGMQVGARTATSNADSYSEGSGAAGDSLGTVTPAKDGNNAYITLGSKNVTLRGNHEWNRIQVIIDVASAKAYMYVNGTLLTENGVKAFTSTANYVQGLRINFSNNVANPTDATLSFDNLNVRVYDNYANSASSFNLSDYVSTDDSYKTLPVTSESIIAKGHAYGTVDNALKAVKGTSYTVRLLGDANECQNVSTAGTVLTLGNSINLIDYTNRKFVSYEKTETPSGDIYTFSYLKNLGTKVNLSLNTSFDINLFIPKTLQEYLTKVELGEDDITDNLIACNVDSVDYLAAVAGRAADEANESVKFTVTFTECGVSFSYDFTVSIAKYANIILADCDLNDASTITEDHILMYYMLNYANQANIYFSEGTDFSLDDTVLTWSSLVSDIELDDANTVDNTNLSDIFGGNTLSLDATPSIQLILNAAAAEGDVYTATYIDVRSGKTLNANVTVSGTTVDIDGIGIYNFGQTVTVYKNGTSVGDYTIATYKAGVTSGADHEALVDALWSYVSYAKAMFTPEA